MPTHSTPPPPPRALVAPLRNPIIVRPSDLLSSIRCLSLSLSFSSTSSLSVREEEEKEEEEEEGNHINLGIWNWDSNFVVAPRPSVRSSVTAAVKSLMGYLADRLTNPKSF